MSKSVDVEVANIKEAMTGLNNEKVITPYSLNQVIKRKAGSGSSTPGVGLNYYWNGTELGVKREDEQDYAFVDLKGEPGSAGSDGVDGTNGIDGVDGRPVELQTTDTHIQWRYTGDVAWVNLIALSALEGADGTNGVDGKEVMLQKTATHIQWKYDTDVTWTNLVALVDLKGADGEGVPVGGMTGQVLKKKTNTDFDTEWGAAADPNAIKSSDGSVTDIREVTQAEYDALTQTEKDEGTFFITDDLVGAISVIDNLNSTSVIDPLSANMGKHLNDIKQNKLLIKDYIVMSNTNSFVISDLDLVGDGGIYDVVITQLGAGELASSVLRVNNVSTGYYNTVNRSWGSVATTGPLNMQGYYWHNEASFAYGELKDGIYGTSIMTIIDGIDCIHFSSIQKLVGSGIQYCGDYCSMVYTTENLTSLTFITVNGFAAGTNVKIYKRG